MVCVIGVCVCVSGMRCAVRLIHCPSLCASRFNTTAQRENIALNAVFGGPLIGRQGGERDGESNGLWVLAATTRLHAEMRRPSAPSTLRDRPTLEICLAAAAIAACTLSQLGLAYLQVAS